MIRYLAGMQRNMWNLLAFLFIQSAMAQVGGRSTFEFLNLISSPRQAALGGKVITIYDDDVNAPLFNPATINVDMGNQLAVNFVDYLGDVTYGSASYAYTYDRHVQTFHAGVTYINYGTFEGRDINGEFTSNFRGNEVALSMGYARNILFTDFYVGGNVKLISSQLEDFTSLGGAVDLGVIYVNERWGVNMSVVIRNLGVQFTKFDDRREDLPFEVIAGISQKLNNLPFRWHLTMENLQQWDTTFENPERNREGVGENVVDGDVSFINNAFRHLLAGVEFFPDKAINLRLGYNFRRGEELRFVEQRSFAGISAGFGLKINNLKFNYTFAKYTTAVNSSFFGLNIYL
jgi:hypothetical protein